MQLEQIESEMLAGDILPARLGELRIILGAKYAQAMNQYEDILMQKPSIWNEMRKDYKSDTATDRAWDATQMGIKELHWKFQIKKIEKMMSALKMQWEIVNTEIRNLTWYTEPT